MSRWGELIPHTGDEWPSPGCLCGCQDEETTEDETEDEEGDDH